MLIPLRVDVPMNRRPYVNVAIIAITIIITVSGFYDNEFFCRWGGIDVSYDSLEEALLGDVRVRVTTEHFPLYVLAITSSLLHNGWLHLLGNMLFLWVFGNAINYKFGHVGYLALYLVAALVSGLAHYGLSDLPVVGASGAIYGVMGAFFIFFPRNDVTVFWMIWFRPGVSRLSSMWLIALWVGWDVLQLLLGMETGVALGAHVGGFVAGLAIGWVCATAGWIKPTQDEETLLQVLGMRRA